MIALKKIKFLKVPTLFLLTLWIAFPKTYVHGWLDHKHSVAATSPETTYSQKGGVDCDFESFSKPLNVFVSSVPLFVGQEACTSVARVNYETGTVFRTIKGKLSLRAPPANA